MGCRSWHTDDAFCSLPPFCNRHFGKRRYVFLSDYFSFSQQQASLKRMDLLLTAHVGNFYSRRTGARPIRLSRRAPANLAGER